MGFNVAQQYNSGTPALGGRGAYGIAPAAGSSNIFGASIPMAGKFAGAFSDPTGALTPEAIQTAFSKDPLGTMMSLGYIKQQQDNTPEARAAERKQTMEDAAAFYKTQGDQQMKYNLINRGLTGLQTGLERGLTQYQDPYTIANFIANGYAEGARSSAGLAQIGQGIPGRQYYNV
jgi:hypothetical protein